MLIIFSIYKYHTNRSINQLMPSMMILQQRLPVLDRQTNERTQTKKSWLNFKPYLDTCYKAVSNFTSLKDYGETLGITMVG